jgi:hypothetical protein
MRRDFKNDRLDDEFGQYEVLLACQCGHTRRVYPQTLAAIAGWDARLTEVVKRFRCSKCGKRECKAKVLAPTVPRGYKSH